MNFNVCEKDIIIRNIELSYGDLWVDDPDTIIIARGKRENEPCVYKITFNIHDKLYQIEHFEPFIMIKDVNYGHGPYYDCCVYNKEKHIFERVEFGKKIKLPNSENNSEN